MGRRGLLLEKCGDLRAEIGRVAFEQRAEQRLAAREVVQEPALGDACRFGHSREAQPVQPALRRLRRRGREQLLPDMGRILPAAVGKAHQWLIELETPLSRTTPAMKPIPAIAGMSIGCRKTTTPITAVNTMPTPAQIA